MKAGDIMDVLILGGDSDRSISLARTLGPMVDAEVDYLDGSQLPKRGDPSKNWVTADYGLVVVETAAVSGMNLIGLDDECTRLAVPILVVTETEEPPFLVFGQGGPYELSKNPPWRYVCREADLDQAAQSFNAWLASQWAAG